MKTIEGRYLDGVHPIAVPASMTVSGREVTITVDQADRNFPVARLMVSPRIGSSDRFITLPDGSQFLCADQVFLDSLRQESRSEGPAAWLEARWGAALAALALIVCTAAVGYFRMLPIAAERIAARVPMETEQALGRQALSLLDKRQWFKPTKLDRDKQQEVLDGFDRLRSGLPLESRYHLEFRDASFIGPNAFALPGGTIVMTDAMVKLANSPDEVQSVLAHEIAHVELRHMLRSVLQNSAVAVLAATITADAASLSVAVAGLPVLMARTRYSRDFETAADEYGFALLKQKGISPEAFAALMERLSKNRKDFSRTFAYLSTHPVTADRIARARAAARE